MKTRTLSLLATLVLTVPMISSHGSDVVAPPGVIYKHVDDAIESKVRQIVKVAFSSGPSDVFALLSDSVICGPAYWSIIKEDSAIRDSLTIPGKVSHPISGTDEIQTFKAALFKDVDARRALAIRLCADVGKQPHIRKLDKEELRVYWGLIPYDIEEPIFVLESNKNRFLIDFVRSEEDFLIFMVDELTRYTLRK